MKQHEAEVKTADICREQGISAATFYDCKSKYCGIDVSKAQRLKTIEDENRRLRLLVAELSLHGEALKAAVLERLVAPLKTLPRTVSCIASTTHHWLPNRAGRL